MEHRTRHRETLEGSLGDPLTEHGDLGPDLQSLIDLAMSDSLRYSGWRGVSQLTCHADLHSRTACSYLMKADLQRACDHAWVAATICRVRNRIARNLSAPTLRL